MKRNNIGLREGKKKYKIIASSWFTEIKTSNKRKMSQFNGEYEEVKKFF